MPLHKLTEQEIALSKSIERAIIGIVIAVRKERCFGSGSLKNVGKHIGVSQTKMHDMESGKLKFPIHQVVQACLVLEMSAEEIKSAWQTAIECVLADYKLKLDNPTLITDVASDPDSR